MNELSPAASLQRFFSASLAEVDAQLLNLSDTLSARYFLPIERGESRLASSLLG